MLGIHTILLKSDARAWELASFVHVRGAPPVPWRTEGRVVASIVSNVMSYKDIVERLNPYGFAEFCGKVRDVLTEIESGKRVVWHGDGDMPAQPHEM